MTQKLSFSTALMLTVPPFLWASNAVVGRLVGDLVPPITLNLLRWLIALLILWPLAGHLLRAKSALWPHWRRFALLGFLGVGCYNALQYLALQTSTPLNVTLVAASTPVFMLAIGALFFKTPVRRSQWLGAVLSITGVLVVLSRGQWAQLVQVQFVVGDVYILVATACWALYSWLLTVRTEPQAIRNHWAAFLLGQVLFGVGWAGLCMPPWLLWPLDLLCWPTGAGAWACKTLAPHWPVFLPTSHLCLRPFCQPHFWVSCPKPSTDWPLA
jgi:drug/metabolite transporter (DMT)-like permease